MPKIVRLTDVQVRKIKEPGRYAIDSRCGRYLVIPPAGAATFVVRKTVDDKRTLRVLGVADRMPLAVARALVAETAQGLVQTAQEAAVTADAPEPLPIFALALQSYLGRKASGWRAGGKSEDQWRQSMDFYALPKIGHLPIDAIRPSHIVEALQPIWSDKVETARRVRQRISAVLMAEFRLRQMTMPDPADQKVIADLMPKIRVEVSKGLPLSDMPVLQTLKKRRLPWTPHGCRAAFRSWVSATGVSSEAAELQLAHTPEKLQQAYQRDGLLRQRRAPLMDWRKLIESDPSAQTPAAAQEALGEADVVTMS